MARKLTVKDEIINHKPDILTLKKNKITRIDCYLIKIPEK
jgi:hypothetical protein